VHIPQQIPSYGLLDPLPSLGVGPEAVKEERLQNISDVGRGLHDVDIARSLDDVEIVQETWITKDFAIAEGTTTGITYARNPTRHNYNDIVVVEALLSGYKYDHIERRIVRDNVWIGTTNSGYFDTAEGSRFAALYLPFEAIGYDPSRHLDNYNFGTDGEVGKIISTALSDALARMPYTPSQNVPAMIGQITELMRDLVLRNRPYANLANFRRARRLAMDAFIEANLNLLAQGAVQHLIQEFNVTRPTLYRIFEADGGVEAYVTRRRLHRTLISLKNTPPERGVVRRIAERFGFVDASNFNRAFRSEFGFCPSEMLGQHMLSGVADT